jgi:hypothetical protein
MFPIDIMPSAIQAVMKWLPFYYELFCLVAIFLGRLKGADLVQALVIQMGWLLLTCACAKAMWKRGPRTLPGRGRIGKATSNAQHPTLNVQFSTSELDVGRSALNVGRFHPK